MSLVRELREKVDKKVTLILGVARCYNFAVKNLEVCDVFYEDFLKALQTEVSQSEERDFSVEEICDSQVTKYFDYDRSEELVIVKVVMK